MRRSISVRFIKNNYKLFYTVPIMNKQSVLGQVSK